MKFRAGSRLFSLATCLLIVVVGGCNQQADKPKNETSTNQSTGKAPSKTEPRTKVTVAAAANLKFAFDAIRAAFAKEHPDIEVVVTYGSSGNIFAQLTQKAPFDLFLSADTQYPNKLVEQNLAAKDAVFVYAIGRIVLWVPNNSPLDLQKLEIKAVNEPSVKKIAIANPKLAPYGQAAEAAMKHFGVLDAAKDRLVLGENISQTAQFVEAGAADVGILALSLALAPELKEKGRYWEIPADAYPPIEQAGAIVSWAKDPEAAKQLQSFITGPEARQILADFGYRAPGK